MFELTVPDLYLFQLNLLPPATLVAERQCFHKRVSFLLSTRGGRGWQGDMRGGGGGAARDTATEAGGTHLTGMHSCITNSALSLIEIKARRLLFSIIY